MSKLTVKQLEALTPESHGKIVREEGNLAGKIAARAKGVSVSFSYRFKWEGKSKDFACGTWPTKSLSDIRSSRDRARQKIADGVNPNDEKKATKIRAQSAIEATIADARRLTAENLTVNDLFEEWLKDGVARQDGNAEIRRSFTKNVLPMIGKRPLRDLTDKDLLLVLRAQSARGLNRGVVILNNDIGQMLRWGEKRKPWRGLMVDGNPSELIDVSKLLDPNYQEERDRILGESEIQELHCIFSQLESAYAALPTGQKYSGVRPVNQRVQCAMWICLSTLCRIGELLKSEWKHVDLDNGTWLIPSENTKGQRGKRQDHHIFLSPFAARQFSLLHSLTGDTPYLFPATKPTNHVDTKSYSKLIGDRQCRFKKRTKPLSGRHNDNTLVLSNGKTGGWTPHDLRRTGATLMQGLGIALEIIDRCQNHLLGGSKVRRHYLHYDYAKEKTHAWATLGAHLETILKNGVLEPQTV